MKKRIYLPKLVPPCPLTRSHALSPQSLPKSSSPVPQLETSHLPLLSKLPSRQSLFGGTAPFSSYSLLAFPSSLPWPQSSFIFTGLVGRRILLVVPVDTLYRTSIISSSTVLPLNLFVNLSLAPLSLFLTYGPDLGVWPDCWVSAEFLRAPILQKGSGSTTTTLYTFCSKAKRTKLVRTMSINYLFKLTMGLPYKFK